MFEIAVLALLIISLVLVAGIQIYLRIRIGRWTKRDIALAFISVLIICIWIAAGGIFAAFIFTENLQEFFIISSVIVIGIPLLVYFFYLLKKHVSRM